MAELSFDLLTPTLFILLTATVYLLMLIVFLNARRRYKGGIVEQVINFVIATIGLLLVADIALFLVPTYGFDIGYTIHVVFKILAMTSLSVGGLKLVTK